MGLFNTEIKPFNLMAAMPVRPLHVSARTYMLADVLLTQSGVPHDARLIALPDGALEVTWFTVDGAQAQMIIRMIEP